MWKFYLLEKSNVTMIHDPWTMILSWTNISKVMHIYGSLLFMLGTHIWHLTSNSIIDFVPQLYYWCLFYYHYRLTASSMCFEMVILHLFLQLYLSNKGLIHLHVSSFMLFSVHSFIFFLLQYLKLHDKSCCYCQPKKLKLLQVDLSNHSL